MSIERWNELLDDKRFRPKSTPTAIDGRNPFENDYGRLISSSPIRRLQDKTQVFPLEKSDYIRTRLTHSLEVSYIASSIGQSVEEKLIGLKKYPKKKKGEMSSLLRVAGLVHDLGNPPFGHFGEEAIKDYFKQHFKERKEKIIKEGKELKETNVADINIGLKNDEIADFENFDGNVQTLRILRRLHYFGDEYSYNLSYPSIASIIKYPSNSTEGNKGKDGEIRYKKFGYFKSDEKIYQEINQHLGLNNRRHPIVYLLEAADDIAYSAADIEDGIKLGLLTYEQIHNVFSKNLDSNKEEVLKTLESIYDDLNHTKSDRISITIQKFRIYTQSKMIEGTIEAFLDNYETIMNGELEDELIEVSKFCDIRRCYKELQYIVFDDKQIVKKELAGYEAISGLLDIFVKASYSNNFKSSGNNKETRLYKIISSSYRHMYETLAHMNYNNDEYNRLQLVVDFISGMTDRYAIDLYQELKGTKL